MKTLSKHASILLLLLSILFAATTCKKEEDYYARTYYEATGIGYVFVYDSADNVLYPVKGATIDVTAGLDCGYSAGMFGPSSPKDTLYTDATGKYQVRFIKRTKRCDVWQYFFHLTRIPGVKHEYSVWDRDFTLSVDTVKNTQGIIELDTLKLYVN
ncbi:MAG: hypothetical protein LBV41_03115 [Cytophagaceae bacterium]|jgi:hypothetical protein|nr:hypothetical protein [Cytophagaceae bacterium]